MKIVFQHPSKLTDELVHSLVHQLPGELRRVSATCFKLENTLFDPKSSIQLKNTAQAAGIDIALLERDYNWQQFKLLAMDMDSTVINIECIDEIADLCGKKTEVAAITEAAMRGEITDFNESLRRRLAILADTDADVLQRVLDERLQLNPGAERLVKRAHAHGLETLLVSGGFSFFTDAIKQRLNLTHARSNELEIINGKITGRVTNTIVNADVKAATVQAYCEALNTPCSSAICMGDGANDLAMMSISGLSVAYHAKPRVQEKAMISFNHMGLDGLIEILN
ncbi:phosphoserine phosphatase SerB [Hydromonas duriensis]|uniref:Phosphoserine phosphatase n=1 Tax=Hydromonas duriensis TaxID=1527608 RepID=A0A4R6YBF5_9BURK|nr:phosphoserine phosphatase SerB [Hydromonas duriensis]TDR32997.1 phosphoserine phosphatase [Hydromonas duriensis]